MNTVIESLEQRNMRTDLPQFKAGDTLRVHFKVIEGNRQRIQVFEGICIKRQGSGFRETFTVASSPSASASSGRSRSTRRRSRSSRSPRSATSVAPSSTTCAREWGRRRASASSDRASVYSRPRASIQRPASPRVRSEARRALRRRSGRGWSWVARRPSRRRRRALRLRAPPRSRVVRWRQLNDSKQVSLKSGRPFRGRAGAGLADQRPRRAPRTRSIATGSIGPTSPGCARYSPISIRPPTCVSSTASASARRAAASRVVDGDARSAAIAAASIVAKVVRDRVMRRLDAAISELRLRLACGYITPAHNTAVRAFGPSELHRRSFQAACYDAA